MAENRTPHEILTAAGIPVVLGGRTWRLRPRPMRAEREWLDAVRERVAARWDSLDGADTVGALIATLTDATDDMLDLVLAWDPDAGIARGWAVDSATSREVTAAFTTLAEEAWPPFAVSRRLVPADRQAQVIGQVLGWALERTASQPPAPTSSPPAPGASAPRRSSRARSRGGSSR